MLKKKSETNAGQNFEREHIYSLWTFHTSTSLSMLSMYQKNAVRNKRITKLLETKICCMFVVATQIPMVRRGGTEDNIRTQVVFATFAIVTHATRNTWFNGNSITWSRQKTHFNSEPLKYLFL